MKRAERPSSSGSSRRSIPWTTWSRLRRSTDTATGRVEAALEAGASISEAEALRRALARSWRCHPANGGSEPSTAPATGRPTFVSK